MAPSEVGEPYVDTDALGMAKPEGPTVPVTVPEPVAFVDSDFAGMAHAAVEPEPAAPVEYVGEVAAAPDRYWRVAYGGFFGVFKADSQEGAVEQFAGRVCEIDPDSDEKPVVEELTGRRKWRVDLPGIGNLQNVLADDEAGAIAEFNRICGVSYNAGFYEWGGVQTDSKHSVEEM